MDDFENPKVRRLRGLGRATDDDNKIPPEQRGMKKCEACDGRGGIFTPHNMKDDLHEFHLCTTCKGKSEVPAV